MCNLRRHLYIYRGWNRLSRPVRGFDSLFFFPSPNSPPLVSEVRVSFPSFLLNNVFRRFLCNVLMFLPNLASYIGGINLLFLSLFRMIAKALRVCTEIDLSMSIWRTSRFVSFRRYHYDERAAFHLRFGCFEQIYAFCRLSSNCLVIGFSEGMGTRCPYFDFTVRSNLRGLFIWMHHTALKCLHF